MRRFSNRAMRVLSAWLGAACLTLTTCPVSTIAAQKVSGERVKEWKKVNADVCAYLDIPDTVMSYPVLQDPKEEQAGVSLYINHDVNKQESLAGTLFMDKYNRADFNEPVSIIYGHHMKSGEFFGTLQDVYQDADSFAKHKEITLELPEEIRSYDVFAAVPYSNVHLMYSYNFADEFEYGEFFRRIASVRSLQAQMDKGNFPEFPQRVLILSTCLQGDNTKRYLVLAKESE